MIYVNNHTKNFLDAISAINKDDSNINPTYETDKKSINPNKPKNRLILFPQNQIIFQE